MVTPELITYIKGEFAKGKTREMIRSTLISEGGWSDADLSDAFRTAIPMQSFATNINPISNNPIQNNVTQNTPPVMQMKPLQSNPVNPTMQNGSMIKNNPIQNNAVHSTFQAPVLEEINSSKSKKVMLVVILVAIVGYAVWWFFGTSIKNSLGSIIGGFSSDSIFVDNTTELDVMTPDLDTTIPATVVVAVKDCGTTSSPDLKDSKTYKDNIVLNCLGASASSCEEANAVLTDALFPNIVQIIKNQDTCSFKLSYSTDSTLSDANGNPLAGQYILCPLSVVKEVDDAKPNAPVFKTPTMTDLNKYASQIYFYGTLGVFMENGADINKIQALGCTGNYIDSVMMSYQKLQ